MVSCKLSALTFHVIQTDIQLLCTLMRNITVGKKGEVREQKMEVGETCKLTMNHKSSISLSVLGISNGGLSEPCKMYLLLIVKIGTQPVS